MKAKRPLVNAEIFKAVEKVRPSITAEVIDSMLTQTSKAGRIQKRPVTGKGRSKFEYFVEKQPSVISVVRESVKGSKIDSMEVYQVVRSIIPDAKKNAVDVALNQLIKRGEIVKSKTPMTDSNVISMHSKFLYMAAPKSK
jgi:hypothetical protein